MLEQIKSILVHQCKIKPDIPMIAAISGGPDSMCLLDILHRMKFELVVAHLDHSLRPESTAETKYVKNVAEKLNIEFVSRKDDVRKYAFQQNLSIEEAARCARYRFLFQQAETFHAQAVVVGHTSDDQIETVLMHLLRGSGLDGLRGMTYCSLPNAWSTRIPIVRPLLDFTRKQIDIYNNSRSLKPIFDHTNLDTTYFRNRIRHELILSLESYNPQFKAAVLRMVDTLQEDHRVLEQAIAQDWQRTLLEINTDFISFNYSDLMSLPLGSVRRIVRRAIFHLKPGLRDIDYKTVNRTVDFLHNPSKSGCIDLMANLYLMVEENSFWIARWSAELPVVMWPQLKDIEHQELTIPGTFELANGWVFQAHQIAKPGKYPSPDQNIDNSFQVILDSDKVMTPMIIRPRKPGDRMQPLGLGGHNVKISDLMVDRKLPRRARNLWPLVTIGDEIVWVPGLHMAERYKVTINTQSAVQITLTKN